MTLGSLHKITHPEAQTTVSQLQLSDRALQLLTPHLSTHDYLLQLAKHHYYKEACQLLAYNLPHREAIWWAYLAAGQSESLDKPHTIAALYLVKQWVFDPNEHLRLATYATAAAQGFTTSSSWVCIATHWTKASSEAAQETPYAVNQAVSNSIILAVRQLVATEQVSLNAVYNYFFCQGITIANGSNGKLKQGLREALGLEQAAKTSEE